MAGIEHAQVLADSLHAGQVAVGLLEKVVGQSLLQSRVLVAHPFPVDARAQGHQRGRHDAGRIVTGIPASGAAKSGQHAVAGAVDERLGTDVTVTIDIVYDGPVNTP